MELLEAHSQTVYTSKLHMLYCLHCTQCFPCAASKAYCYVKTKNKVFVIIDPGPPFLHLCQHRNLGPFSFRVLRTSLEF